MFTTNIFICHLNTAILKSVHIHEVRRSDVVSICIYSNEYAESQCSEKNISMHCIMDNGIISDYSNVPVKRSISYHGCIANVQNVLYNF